MTEDLAYMQKPDGERLESTIRLKKMPNYNGAYTIRLPESQELPELRRNIVKYSHFAAKIRKSVRLRV